jgi:hypothetical protein
MAWQSMHLGTAFKWASRAVNVQALDLSTKLAHAHWKELYNFSEHKCFQGQSSMSLEINK